MAAEDHIGFDFFCDGDYDFWAPTSTPTVRSTSTYGNTPVSRLLNKYEEGGRIKRVALAAVGKGYIFIRDPWACDCTACARRRGTLTRVRGAWLRRFGHVVREDTIMIFDTAAMKAFMDYKTWCELRAAIVLKGRCDFEAIFDKYARTLNQRHRERAQFTPVCANRPLRDQVTNKLIHCDLAEIEKRVLFGMMYGQRKPYTKELVVNLSQVPSQKEEGQTKVLDNASPLEQYVMGVDTDSHGAVRAYPTVVGTPKGVPGLITKVTQESPYTIKEHMNVSNKIKAITVGRTTSANYQSKKFEITLEVGNDDEVTEVTKLAQGIVDVTLEARRIPREERIALNKFGREYFSDPDFSISDFSTKLRDE